ncbi:MAG TPA: tRNA (adenosine(37)-N6)-threonylcarbamoyltransferase complex ATPase subunit type 1 TsaE [Candidatus Onthovicinus excrementipullorum]|nr:tRNA (adenosine(37)-N6)-threonylcarbamoyltransferase complex ATPase subunit type 1 TsaE [Candidatus Onthovicinus excrementipullorum]
MAVYLTHSEEETAALGEKLAGDLSGGGVVAMFGGLGMGKTAFVRGMARVLTPDAAVTSPTFALVNAYGGHPPLYHFDMYRVGSWEDLYSTGFFDYLDQKSVLAIEWSENIENAIPAGSYLVEFERLGDSDRRITITKKTEEDVL